MSQLNKQDSGGYSAYSTISKDDIVKIMSKFEIYDAYLVKKDREAAKMMPFSQE